MPRNLGNKLNPMSDFSLRLINVERDRNLKYFFVVK